MTKVSVVIPAYNAKKAMHYRQQAVLHYPQLHNTSIYIRLSLRIATMRWFGPQGYERVRGITRTVRQLMLGTAA
jgi:hypothetical protein